MSDAIKFLKSNQFSSRVFLVFLLFLLFYLVPLTTCLIYCLINLIYFLRLMKCHLKFPGFNFFFFFIQIKQEHRRYQINTRVITACIKSYVQISVASKVNCTFNMHFFYNFDKHFLQSSFCYARLNMFIHFCVVSLHSVVVE